MADKTDVVLIRVPKKHIIDGLSAPFNSDRHPEGQRRSGHRQGRLKRSRRGRHRRADKMMGMNGAVPEA